MSGLFTERSPNLRSLLGSFRGDSTRSRHDLPDDPQRRRASSAPPSARPFWAAPSSPSSAGSRSPPAGSMPRAARPRRSQRHCATPTASKSGSTNVVNQIYRRDGQGVAFIQAEIPAKRSPSPFGSFGEEESEKEGGGTATGSGIVIDTNGHILTNNHVIAGANHIQVKLGASNTAYDATVVGTDPATDLALLKVNAPVRPASPAAARQLLEDRSRRPGGRDRQPLRPRSHRDQRHRLGAPAPDPGPRRLLDLQRDPDRRGDQPRQLRRPADRSRRQT